MSILLWTAATALVAAPMQQAPEPANDPMVPQSTTVPSPPQEPPTVTAGGQIDRAGTGTTAVSASPAPASPIEQAPQQLDARAADNAISPADLPAENPHPHQGDIVVTGQTPGAATDPFRGVNETSFKATMAVDNAITGPIAMAYKKTAPKPFRSGVHNFLYNMREPVVFVNFVLQHKIGKAAETVGRFAINTTIGVAGLFDMAKRKPFKLPRRGNGFADTLGFYGVPNGPFMFLPLVGPTTVRDLFGGAVDRLILPATFGKRITKPEVAIPLGVLGVLDHRSEFDDTLHTLHDNVPSPYANTRTFYLQRRQAEIDHLRGRSTGSSSPMSEAPTAPVDNRGREVKPRPTDHK